MGNSDRKTAAIRKLLGKADCPRTTCSRSSATPETDAVEFEVIDDYECGINVVSSGLARKLERERNEYRTALKQIRARPDWQDPEVGFMAGHIAAGALNLFPENVKCAATGSERNENE